ncbi:histone deacetylase 9-B [Trichomycterus rosablanca]|uniref:histone deacetylase 9-B n=1 Tax=Trichomycterus rosablanca TaxID=2290929 RepID=UPI002F352B76
MLQTIYEGDSRFSRRRLPGDLDDDMLSVDDSDVKPEVPSSPDPASPLDLRTDGRAPAPGSDPGMWERQLQQELVLIQKQQQIQKQLLINEFQKQHENLIRQHQVQLQEHLKLQQELQAMKQQQELLEKEKKLELQNQERELERHRRQQQVLIMRNKERARESAVASTEVKQKLQEFLLNKSTKDVTSTGSCHAFTPIHTSTLWFTTSHDTALEQSSPPLGEVSPPCKFRLTSLPHSRDDFPLRKTASEPNLKVRSRLKQKVAERRSSPLLRRKEGAAVTPFKKRALELMDPVLSSASPGSAPGSPNGFLCAENGPSSLPATTFTECWPSQMNPLGPEGSVPMLSLYTSSLPNITLSLSPTASSLSAGLGLTEKHGDASRAMPIRPGVPAQLLAPVSLAVGVEKVSSSQQVLLQHLLQKEQLRHQKIGSAGPGVGLLHPPSPLAAKDRSLGVARPRLPRHRPLHRTQSAPLPQSMLAQLVLQQQHQHFLETQKQFQHQVHINTLLSKSIEQMRRPSVHLQESEEEEGEEAHELGTEEESSPSGGAIRKRSPVHNSNRSGVDAASEHDEHAVIRIKEEPDDSDDETHAQQELVYLRQVEGRLVIRAVN